jgi:hypothetical protein
MRRVPGNYARCVFPDHRLLPDVYRHLMAPAAKLPAGDPQARMEAVRRAAAGERIHLLDGDGRRVADVVPPADSTTVPVRRSVRRPGESDDELADRVTREFFAAVGGTLPRLEDYQRVYASLGVPWPGDDVACTPVPRRRPVAGRSTAASAQLCPMTGVARRRSGPAIRASARPAAPPR